LYLYDPRDDCLLSFARLVNFAIAASSSGLHNDSRSRALAPGQLTAAIKKYQTSETNIREDQFTALSSAVGVAHTSHSRTTPQATRNTNNNWPMSHE
jgi:hypothetical protein